MEQDAIKHEHVFKATESSAGGVNPQICLECSLTWEDYRRSCFLNLKMNGERNNKQMTKEEIVLAYQEAIGDEVQLPEEVWKRIATVNRDVLDGKVFNNDWNERLSKYCDRMNLVKEDFDWLESFIRTLLDQRTTEILSEIYKAGNAYDMAEEMDASEPMFNKIDELKDKYGIK